MIVRFRKTLWASVFLLFLCCSSAMAEPNSLHISGVVQTGGVLSVYLNQYTGVKPITDTFDADMYTVTAAGYSYTPNEVQYFARNNTPIYYTFLYDDTFQNLESKRINDGITDFAKSLRNEFVRVLYYDEKIRDHKQFTNSVDRFKQSAGTSNDAFRLKQYGNNTRISPYMNQALIYTLSDIAQNQYGPLSNVYHAVIVVSDTDAEAYDISVENLLKTYHIPVYFLSLGNGIGNISRYAECSGGAVYLSGIDADSVSKNLEKIRSILKNTMVLSGLPPYEVFSQGNVNIHVSLNTGNHFVESSQDFSVVLSTNNVSTPTPMPTPVPSPTPTIVPFTPVPKPTMPPKLDTATPVPATAPPTALPSPVPVVVTSTHVPPAAPTFTPAPTPPPATIPPTIAPTLQPTVVPTPTATPLPEDLFSVFTQKTGLDRIWLIAGGLVLAFGIILMIVFMALKKRKQPSNKGKTLNPPYEDTTTPWHDGVDPDITNVRVPDCLPGTTNSDDENDKDKTTSSFSVPLNYQRSMFVSAKDDEKDMYEKTVAVSVSPEQKSEKPSEPQDDYGLKIRFLIEQNGESRELLLPMQQKLILGRRNTCDVCLNDPKVSSIHAEITYEADGLYITDLNSTNGIVLNEEKIENRSMLRNQDVLIIGDCMINIEILI